MAVAIMPAMPIPSHLSRRFIALGYRKGIPRELCRNYRDTLD